MSSKAATIELRWRLADIGGVPGEWNTKTVPAKTSSIKIEGLERGRDYEGEARAVSAAGAASEWVPVTFTVADASMKPRAPTTLTALPVADAVSLKWTADAKQPADVEYSIEVGTSGSGPWSEFTQTRAMQYSLPLNDSTVRWFRVRAVNFGAVFSAYSNIVSAAAIPLAELEADVAAAAADAAAALAELSDIASDGKLTAGEKIEAKREYEQLVDEQAEIDAKADVYEITTEKSAYDVSITALKDYLRVTVGVLNGSNVWTNVTGTTNITRTTWNTRWKDVYAKRQSLLNAIYQKAKSIADAAVSLVQDGGFENKLISWTVTPASRASPSSGQTNSGTYACLITPDAGGAALAIRNAKLFGCRPGERIQVKWFTRPSGSSPNAPIRIGIRFGQSDGTLVSNIYGNDVPAHGFTWTPHKDLYTVPAGATNGYLFIHQNGGLTSGNWLVDDIDASIQPDSVDDVPDGVAYVRYGIEDAYFTGGKWRNGLRFNASGQQVSGAFNFPPGGFASVGAAWVTGGTVTYTATAGTPATATINVSALTLRSMGTNISYSSSSVGTTGTGGTVVNYHLYYDDDLYAGGARTLGATTSMNTIVNSRSRLYVGSVAIAYPTVGSGGGSGGTPCPTVSSRLACGRRAGRIRIGEWLRLADPYDGLRARLGKVSRATPALAPCVRLVTDRGAVFEGSTSAPIPTRDGYRNAPDTVGCEVPIRRVRWTWLRPFAWLLRNCDWAWREGWERISVADEIGEQWVQHITCENACFWVGKRMHALFLHHNIKQDP